MRVPSGITGLDEMLSGGFPSNRAILVCGGPGSGKTIFSLQFLMAGANSGERGVYATLEEPLNLIEANMASVGIDLGDLERKNRLRLLDWSQLIYKAFNAERYENRSKPVIADLVNEITQVVEDFKARRLAVDPVTTAVIHQRFPTEKRSEVVELFKALRSMQCTSVVTSEFSSSSAEGEFFVEEYLADGVIVLSKSLKDFKLVKTLRVEKMRGVKHDDQPRRYEITGKGLIVYHTEPVTT